MSAAIRKARATFVPPNVGEVRVSRIRSHSGRHRAVNDLKMSTVKGEVGRRFARISSEKVWEKYGRITAEQAAEELKANEVLQTLWNQMY